MPSTQDDPLRGSLQSDEALERLTAAHRYMQVGMCVSSVTHDINNHLGAVMAYAELLAMEHSDPETVHMVEEIIGAVKRSSALIEDLTAVARKDREEVTQVSTTDITERVIGLRMYDLKIAGIRLEQQIPDEGRLLTCDRPKLEQALLYLLSNGMEATRDTERPVIRLALTHDDDGATFSVWDSGPGIATDRVEASFEPLVTTKASPHLGLGLFAAKRIAEWHGGSLAYSPERGMSMQLPWTAPAGADSA